MMNEMIRYDLGIIIKAASFSQDMCFFLCFFSILGHHMIKLASVLPSCPTQVATAASAASATRPSRTQCLASGFVEGRPDDVDDQTE